MSKNTLFFLFIQPTNQPTNQPTEIASEAPWWPLWRQIEGAGPDFKRLRFERTDPTIKRQIRYC